MGSTVFLGAFGATADSVATGASWWQTLGGMLVVFTLLILSLKALGRFQRRGGRSHAAVLDVWHLGPKREIQILQMGQDVHYVYRHDNAMVLLKQMTLAEHRREHGAPQADDAAPAAAGGWLARARSWLPAQAPTARRGQPERT
jgi:flagellar biogenesis protein FliO